MCETFDDGGLADTGLADQDGIVLCAAGEDLHDAANFLIAADDGIELGAAREVGQVAGVFFERGVGGFGVLRSYALAAAKAHESLENGLMRSAVPFEKSTSRVAVFASDGKEEMLGRDIFVLEFCGFIERALQDVIQSAAKVLLGESLDFGQALDLALDVLCEKFAANAEPGEQRWHNTIGLLHKRGEQMDGFNRLVLVAPGNLLSLLKGFLGLDGHFVKTQHKFLTKDLT